MLVEGLEDRRFFAAFELNSGTLLITGKNVAEQILVSGFGTLVSAQITPSEGGGTLKMKDFQASKVKRIKVVAKAGNDHISINWDGFDGKVTLLGGSGNDSLSCALITGNATLVGGAGADSHMAGGFGDDLLKGKGGIDSMSGGDGNDTLIGGKGSDLFSGDNGDDVINADDGETDGSFSGGDGTDRAIVDVNKNEGKYDIFNDPDAIDDFKQLKGIEKLTKN